MKVFILFFSFAFCLSTQSFGADYPNTRSMNKGLKKYVLKNWKKVDKAVQKSIQDELGKNEGSHGVIVQVEPVKRGIKCLGYHSYEEDTLVGTCLIGVEGIDVAIDYIYAINIYTTGYDQKMTGTDGLFRLKAFL